MADTDSAQLPLTMDESSHREYAAQLRLAAKEASRIGQNRSIFLADAGSYAGSVGVAMPWTAGDPAGHQRRGRMDWTRQPLSNLYRWSRQLAAHHWFAGSVVGIREAFTTAGFRFSNPATRERFATPTADDPFSRYAWAAMAEDLYQEFAVCDNAIAIWRRQDRDDTLEPGEFPFISVLNCEEVDYRAGMGREVVSFVPPRIDTALNNADGRAIDENTLVELYGEMIGHAMLTNQQVVLKSWDENREIDFCYLGRGKRGHGYLPPRMHQIFQDLEYLEMVRLGDYTGAYARKDAVRHTSKGYAVAGGGPLAGQPIHHITKPTIRSILDYWDAVEGKGKIDVATNFDVGIQWITFPTEFWSEKLGADARQRLIQWGGYASLMLMDGMANAQSGGQQLSLRLRAEVTKDRDLLRRCLLDIWSRESFLGPDLANDSDRPDLTPTWSQSVLYNTAELVNLTNALHTTGCASTQTLRENYHDLDNAQEVERLKEAHRDRTGYMPTFESRQGLLPLKFEDLQPEDEEPNQPNPTDGGNGGGQLEGGGRPLES